MRYIVVDAAEFTYPDRFDYESASAEALVDTARGVYASFQILLDGLSPDRVRARWIPEEICKSDAPPAQAESGFPRTGDVSVKTDLPFETEFYSLVPVTVELNHNLKPEHFKPHFPERIAPYRVYDCLRPFDGTLDVGVGDGRARETGIAGMYCAVKIPCDAVPGEYSCSVEITVAAERVTVPLRLTVYRATVPEETLTMIQGYNMSAIARYHGVAYGSEEFYELDAAYVKLLRRMRQNMAYVGRPKCTEIGTNQYEFDFSAMEAMMRRRLSQGIRCFMMPSVGMRQSWSASTILLNGKIPAMSYEGYCYLSQYLPALHDMLERNGWLDLFVMSVSDEPNDANCTEFRALCGLVRKFVPDIRLVDAMSYGNLHGSLDIWVPLNAEYDQHRAEIETLRANGDEIWHYVCCVPRSDEYINRFLDYALLSTRYLFWGNYKYDLTGYLHWAANCYQPGQDPFRRNCPEHRNADSIGNLPAGDTHLIYPGENGPWLSMRAEAQREGIEEFEMLTALARVDRKKADAICESVFRSFRDVEYGVSTFRAAKKELLEALS